MNIRTFKNSQRRFDIMNKIEINNETNADNIIFIKNTKGYVIGRYFRTNKFSNPIIPIVEIPVATIAPMARNSGINKISRMTLTNIKDFGLI